MCRVGEEGEAEEMLLGKKLRRWILGSANVVGKGCLMDPTSGEQFSACVLGPGHTPDHTPRMHRDLVGAARPVSPSIHEESLVPRSLSQGHPASKQQNDS